MSPAGAVVVDAEAVVDVPAVAAVFSPAEPSSAVACFTAGDSVLPPFFLGSSKFAFRLRETLGRTVFPAQGHTKRVSGAQNFSGVVDLPLDLLLPLPLAPLSLSLVAPSSVFFS